MPIINDAEFGKIVVRKYPSSSSIKLRRAPNGDLRVSAPLHTPDFIIRGFLKQSRKQILDFIESSKPDTEYKNGMQIGKSHSLIVIPGGNFSIISKKNIITVSLPDNLQINDDQVVDQLRPVIIKALRKEARSYLPRRLEFMANEHGFTYRDISFSHSSGKWGSCRNDGRISLNIALMKLPFELIDYVIAHELSHTVELNHSPKFWETVSIVDPDYKNHRKLLKNESPNI